MNNLIQPPWAAEQIEALDRYQKNVRVHPYTCGGDRDDEAHRRYAIQHGQTDFGILVPTENGWACPVCDYKQEWAHRMSLHIIPSVGLVLTPDKS